VREECNGICERTAVPRSLGLCHIAGLAQKILDIADEEFGRDEEVILD
jgi:hypothetical protein